MSIVAGRLLCAWKNFIVGLKTAWDQEFSSRWMMSGQLNSFFCGFYPRRTWDQKLSSGLLLTFMSTHIFQFRFDQWVFERMTKDTTLTAPSTMKIMVVAPPNGNIFTVGAKRFRYAEVLATQVSPSQLYSRCLCCCVTATLMSLSVCQDALARVSALSCY